MKYCTYLTIYKGNLLPPFYIGFSLTDKVINKNYHGSVSSRKFKTIWKSELENSPHLFITKIISQHDTMKEAKQKETKLQKHLSVDINPLYINAFVQGNDFCIDMTGFRHSEETIQKMKIARTGKQTALKGRKLTESHKRKISESSKGKKHSVDVVEKRANSRRGKKNQKKFSEESNIQRAIRCKELMTEQRKEYLSNLMSGENNPFYGQTHSEETIEKLKNVDRSYLKNLYWWTNGETIIRSENQPGEDFIRGRRKFSKSDSSILQDPMHHLLS